MNPVWLKHRIPFPLVVLASFWLCSSGSHCDQDEIKKCKEAASKGEVQSFEMGGICEEKPYVHYTHVCVSNTKFYTQGISSCCCVNSRRVMCCKYKQDWNFFRCSEPDDTIEHLSGWSSPDGSSPLKRPPLAILIPLIVAPLILIGCCIFCAIKCCRCRKDPETNKSLCNIKCLSCCGKTKLKPTKSETRPSVQGSHDQGETSPPSEEAMRYPVTSQYSTESRGSEAKLLPGENDPVESPLSPPYTERPFHFSHAGYSRLNSSSSGVLRPVPERQNSELREINSPFSHESKGSEAKLLPSMDDPVAIATAPLDEETDFSCPNYPEDYNRMCSEGSSRDPERSVGSGPYRDSRREQGGADVEAGGGSEVRGQQPYYPPSVAYMCPPPAYSDHHRDPVIS